MNESKATRYQRLRRRASAAIALSYALGLLVVATTPLARLFADFAERFAAHVPAVIAGPVAAVAFVTPVVLAAHVASFPATVFLALSVEGAYGGRRRTLDDVLATEGLHALSALAIAAVAAWLLRQSAAWAGAAWWILAAVALAAVMAAALRGAPTLVRLTMSPRPLHRGNLVRYLTELARRAGTPIARIDECDVPSFITTSALVTGVGKGRRILVSSEIAAEWPDEEVAVVVAHELGHHAHHDLWRTLAADVLLMGASLLAADVVVRAAGPPLGLRGPGDLAALPLVALAAGGAWVLTTPIRHAQSRRQERRADAFALAATGFSEAFANAIKRLGARHLAEERPSALTRWFYHRHPPVAERLALAEEYGRRRPGAAAG